MKWFKKRLATNPSSNPMHKYVERKHWDQLITNFNHAQQKNIEAIVETGLQYEGNVNHTGDALLLFDAYFAMRGEKYSQRKRQLADLFCSERTLKGFDKVDRQYLIDVAAASLRLNYWPDSQKDRIHKIANDFPSINGVNPLLTRCFRIVAEKPVVYKVKETDAPLLKWYLINLQKRANLEKANYNEIIAAVKKFQSGTAKADDVELITNSLQNSMIDEYAEHFSVPPGISTKDMSLIRSRLYHLRNVVRRAVEEKNSTNPIDSFNNPNSSKKLRGPRETSISESQIIGVSWSAKKNTNGAILEYARSGHGGGIAKVQMSAEEFELLKQGKGIHAAFFTKEEREKFFGSTDTSDNN